MVVFGALFIKYFFRLQLTRTVIRVIEYAYGVGST